MNTSKYEIDKHRMEPLIKEGKAHIGRDRK